MLIRHMWSPGSMKVDIEVFGEMDALRYTQVCVLCLLVSFALERVRWVEKGRL